MFELNANCDPEGEEAAVVGSVSRYRYLGERLRELRLERALTQAEVEQLAQRLSRRQKCPEFALTESRLSRIENGWSVPGPAKLLSLAKIYHLSVRDLVRLRSRQQSKELSSNQAQG